MREGSNTMYLAAYLDDLQKGTIYVPINMSISTNFVPFDMPISTNFVPFDMSISTNFVPFDMSIGTNFVPFDMSKGGKFTAITSIQTVDTEVIKSVRVYHPMSDVRNTPSALGLRCRDFYPDIVWFAQARSDESEAAGG